MELTQEYAKQLGFALTKRYEHDEWETFRYTKGPLELEFTYRRLDRKLETVDVTIDETVGLVVTVDELSALDRIINKNQKQ